MFQDEIVRLSESYVKQLARETENTVDGPFAARFTGYGNLHFSTSTYILRFNLILKLTLSQLFYIGFKGKVKVKESDEYWSSWFSSKPLPTQDWSLTGIFL